MSLRVLNLCAGALAAVAASAAALALAAPAAAAGPTAIATDSDGVVYVGYASGGTIERFRGSDGAQLGSWGTAGNAPGKLGGIVALDVAPGDSGNVWVLDTNRRVQEFTRSGTYVRGFQLEPCATGISPDPALRGGLDVTTNMIYVVHPCRDKVQRFAKGTLVEKAWTSGVPGPLKGASAQLYGTAPANTQYLYVARPTHHDIWWFDLGSLGWHGPKNVGGRPTDTFVDAYGVLFVSDAARDQIHMYGSDGSEFRTLGGSGTTLGKLDAPNAFDVFGQYSDLAGNLFIADTGNSRIQRWNPYGYTFWGASADGGGAVAAPANTALPQISGSPVQGRDVTCTDGSWTNSPTSYAYRWRRDGSNISGATSQTYAIAAADVGHALTCTVIATNPAGSASATSTPVTPSAAATPANTSPPQISGSAVVGNTLSCDPGTWSNSPDYYTYRWRRNGAIVATGQSYTVVAADVGAALTCQVLATNADGTGTASSAAVTPTAGSSGGEVGVTINDAAVATNSPGVTLTIHEPTGADAVRISNDGGFGSADTRAIRGDDTYTWTLESSGPERLPKTVYVRFSGTGIDPSQTYTDDIVLDQTPPTPLRQTLRGSTLRLRARDAATGVAKVEYTRRVGARKIVTHDYERRIHVKHRRRVRWARFVDGAGNRSTWKRVEHVHRHRGRAHSHRHSHRR